MKITRRALAGVALAGAAAAQTADTPPAQPAPTDELPAAQKQVARNSETLLKYEVSMAVEPAFQFKA